MSDPEFDGPQDVIAALRGIATTYRNQRISQLKPLFEAAESTGITVLASWRKYLDDLSSKDTGLIFADGLGRWADELEFELNRLVGGVVRWYVEEWDQSGGNGHALDHLLTGCRYYWSNEAGGLTLNKSGGGASAAGRSTTQGQR